MSRCFPFPPPGYLRNGPRSDALIQSIKLRTDMEKAKKDRKERKKEKKEKKEKRREEKEKKKEEKERKRKESSTSHSNCAAKKFKLIDEIKETKAEGKLQKVENEQVERSVITEELDQPVSSREPCTSDSSQNSKRKRGGALVPSHDLGPDIRIRLPLRKHTEPEKSKEGFHLGSSSGNVGVADSSTQDIRSDGQVKCTTNVENNLLLGNSHSRDCNALPNLVPGNSPVTNVIVDDEGRRMASLYNSLCQIQIPLLTYYGFDSADQDWLFSSKPTEAKRDSKKPKTDSDAFRCSKSLWPVAQYLPEVEIYAFCHTQFHFDSLGNLVDSR